MAEERKILNKDVRRGYQGQKQVRVDETEGQHYVAHLKTLVKDKEINRYIVADEGEDYVEFSKNDKEVKGKGYTAIDGKIRLKANVDEEKKIYEYYTVSGVKHIVYYDLNGKELVKAEVDKNGQMTFDFGNRFNDLTEGELSTAIKDIKDKVRAVLNYDGFPSVDTFDHTLAQLEYSLLQLKDYQKAKEEKENIIIDTKCMLSYSNKYNDENVDYIAEKLIESLENPKQIRICDFGYNIYENDDDIGGHNVQMSISKGRLIMMNTGGGGKYNEVLLKEIEDAVNRKIYEKTKNFEELKKEYSDKITKYDEDIKKYDEDIKKYDEDIEKYEKEIKKITDEKNEEKTNKEEKKKEVAIRKKNRAEYKRNEALKVINSKREDLSEEEKERYLEYKDKIETSEFKGVDQNRGNCVMVSKLYAVTLLSDNGYDSKKLIKAISRLENIVRIVNERGGTNKLTYEELSRLKESDVKLLNDFVIGINEDVKKNNKKNELTRACKHYKDLFDKIKEIDERIKKQGKNFVRGIKPKAILTDKDKEVIKKANKSINRDNGHINQQIIARIKGKALDETNADQKMQYYLTAIKLGDKESIDKYFKALDTFCKDEGEKEILNKKINTLNQLLDDDLFENKSKNEYIKSVISRFENEIGGLEKERVITSLNLKDINGLEEYFREINRIFEKQAKYEGKNESEIKPEEKLTDEEEQKLNDFNENFKNNVIKTTMLKTILGKSESSMSLKSLVSDFFEKGYYDLGYNILTSEPVDRYIINLRPSEKLFNTIINNEKIINNLVDDSNVKAFCWDALIDSIANGENLHVFNYKNIAGSIAGLISCGNYFLKPVDEQKKFATNLASKIKKIKIDEIKVYKHGGKIEKVKALGSENNFKNLEVQEKNLYQSTSLQVP